MATLENLAGGVAGSYTGGSGWLCPSGVTQVIAHCIGGGGGSGGGKTLVGPGGGGGGGEYRRKLITGLVPGTRYDFTIGAGGTGGTGSAGTPTAGVAGGDSWFKSTGDVLAHGGGGGDGGGGAGGTGGSSGTGTTGFNGGAGAQGGSNGGAGGGAGGDSGAGGAGLLNVGGAGGSGTVLAGAAGATRTVVAGGNPGSQPGGGAASGTSANASNGALGGDGKIILEYSMEETFGDDAALTDSVAPVIIPGDPSSILNHVYDIRKGSQQIYQVKRGTATAWNYLSPYPFTFTMGDPASAPGVPWHFVVPEGCTQIIFNGKGARGGNGAGWGGPPQTTGGGLGGFGGSMVGAFPVESGQVVRGYTGARGGHGWQDPYANRGEPGGAASQLNIFAHEYEALGGCGGGGTLIFLDDELIVAIGGGGGGGAGSASSQSGGAGGAGGGTTGGTGAAGQTNTIPAYPGQGGVGGSQVAGGLGGVGGNSGNGAGDGRPGVFLAGGSTYRKGAYGTGTISHPCGGGGGGGYYGGGGGGNGSVPLAFSGGAGGGGGGSSWFDAIVEIDINTQGTNTSDQGFLAFTFFAKRTYQVT